LEFRWRRGLRACLEPYLEQFPELGPPSALEPRLIYEEYRVRQQAGDRPPLADYRARFPAQFAELERLVRVDPVPTLVGLTQTGSGGFASRAPPDAPGSEILEKLGEGGMGIVYRARDRRRQRIVALKTMHRIDPTALYRFKQEFRALVGRPHPNLVTLYELVADEQHCFFTMELIEGTDFLS